jgi:hypothetical protein
MNDAAAKSTPTLGEIRRLSLAKILVAIGLFRAPLNFKAWIDANMDGLLLPGGGIPLGEKKMLNIVILIISLQHSSQV